jgi:photosystem II stability/assembly factor-like uncharacterized protein
MNTHATNPVLPARATDRNWRIVMNKRLQSLLILLALLSHAGVCLAQWTQTSLSPTSTVTDIVRNGQVLYAVTDSNRVFASSNEGNTWIARTNGLNSSGICTNCLMMRSGIMFLGGCQGVYRSTNGGADWFNTSIGLQNQTVRHFAADSTNIYAGTFNGLYRSSDFGVQWVRMSGLDNTPVTGLAILNSYLFVGTDLRGFGSLLRTSNLGSSWIWIMVGDSINSSTETTSLQSNGSYLFVADGHLGIVRSSDNGATWVDNYPWMLWRISCIAIYGTKILAGSADFSNLRYSPDNAAHWYNVSTNIPSGVNCIAFSDSSVYVGTNLHGIWKLPLSQLVPVEIGAFTAARSGGNVVLRWRTESEAQNTGFDVERMFDDERDWRTVGFVRGQGTSNLAHEYRFEDHPPRGNAAAYRLAQIDMDGARVYSPVVRVERAAAAPGGLSLEFPNPARATARIAWSIARQAPVSILIVDALGRVLLRPVDGESFSSGRYDIDVSLAGLPDGGYFVHLIAGAERVTKFLAVVK